MFNKKSKIILFATFVIFAVSAVLITLETVTTGAEISKLEASKENLSKQKRELEESYVKTISMGSLQEKGNELGFVKPSNLMYLSRSEPVAVLR